jgi:hypothetical protein
MGCEPGLATWEHVRGSDEQSAAVAPMRRRRHEIRLKMLINATSTVQLTSEDS